MALVTGSLAGFQSPARASASLAVPSQYPTIQAALDAAAPGDTVLVSPGTYAENVDFAGKDVSLRSTDGAPSTVIAAPANTGVDIGPGARIVGFTISGASGPFIAGMLVRGNGTVVAKNIFRSNRENSGLGYGAAISGNGASPTITKNIFEDNTCSTSFYLAGVVSFVNDSSPLIVNNVFHDNPCKAINLTLTEGNRPRLIGNTIVRNAVGVRIDGRVESSLIGIRNNIVAENGIGLEVEYGHGPNWTNNLLFANSTDYSGIADLTGSSGNRHGDPKFMSSDTNDFHLSTGSAAIAAGIDTLLPPVDFDGYGRPKHKVDIGAFQLVAVPSAPYPVAAVPYGDGGAKVIWTRPSSGGGSGVMRYVVTPYLAGVAQATRTFGPAHTIGIVTGLQDARTYRFAIAAVSAEGAGPSSLTTVAVAVGALGVPGKPAMLKTSAGSLQATFAAPMNNGAPIVSFVVRCLSSDGGISRTKSASASPITVSGLTSGRTYTCKVNATNSRGAGPGSVASDPANA